METKRFNAYNSTRGTALNARLAVADRELEPLRFLELLIGGLGLDSESGVWLKPLASAPQIPRVFPFDLVYLDENHKVIRAAEVFPSGDFPPFSEDVVSALILPLHAVSATQTVAGDQLLIEAVDEATESASITPERATNEIQSISVTDGQALEVALTAAKEQRDLPSISELVAKLAAPFSEERAAAKIAPAPQSKPLAEFRPTPPAPAPSTQDWALPLEGFWAPQKPEHVADTMNGSTEPKEPAKALGAAPPPASGPVDPVAANSTGTAEQKSKKAPGSTTSASGSAVRNVGSTRAQYKTWQVSNSTPSAPALDGQKLSPQKAGGRISSGSTRIVAQTESKKKSDEKPLRSLPSAEPTSQQLERRSGSSSPKLEVTPKASTSGQVDVPGKNPLPDPAKAQSTASPVAEITKAKAKSPALSAGSHVPDPATKRPDTQLPLWKAAPAESSSKPSTQAASPVRRATEPPPRRIVDSVPAPESGNGAESPKPPVKKGVKPSVGKSLVEQAAQLSSHLPRMPEALSRLMTALQHMGAHPQSQSAAKAAKSKGSAPNKVSTWLNPEALHRDRRRAVRRTVPGLVAFYFTGGAPQPYTVADISATGFFLVTRDQWMPETMIQMTLQKPVAEGKQRRESLTVLTKIVRRGEDGIGAEFVMPETLDPHNRDIKPSRATDRMALARFLFSEEFPDSYEVLGCFITPSVEQQGSQDLRVGVLPPKPDEGF
jgi:hypothetical protein